MVEDNAINQKVVTRMLELAGFECDIAENRACAVGALEDRQYALVLMDCQMPVMDGYSATRAIRDRERDSGARACP